MVYSAAESLFTKYIHCYVSIFNELVIKNDPVKKAIPFSVFVEGFQLPHDQALVLEDRT